MIEILEESHFAKHKKLKRFTSITYVQGFSDFEGQILTQVGIGVALKPHHTSSSLFPKQKHDVNFEIKRGLVYQISLENGNAVYIDKMERTVGTQKRKHVDAFKTFNTKMSALIQHVVNFNC